MTPQTSIASKTRSPTKTRKQAPDENILDSIHASQEAVVDLTKELVDSIGDVVPNLWNRQIVEGAPAIHEVTDAAFDLTRKVLDAQIEFTKRLVDSVVYEFKKLN